MILPPPIIPERRAETGADMAWLIGEHSPPLYYAPPLYHILAAWLTFWSEMDDLGARLIPNPSWEAGWSPSPGTDPWNKNVFVHLPGETLAESATVRATTFLRCLSLLLGAVTVGCTYAIVHYLWPHHSWLALGAAACVAFNPQFVAASTSVSNDPLLTAIFSLALLQMVHLLMEATSSMDDQPQSLSKFNRKNPFTLNKFRWTMLGTLVGLGMLTKQSAFLLLPLGGLVLLMQRSEEARKQRGRETVTREEMNSHIRFHILRPTFLLNTLALYLPALVIGGWWYIYNGLHYGDFLGTAPHFAAQVPLARFDLVALLSTFRSYWMGLGWGLILAPSGYYWLVGVMYLIACVGLCRALLPGGAFWREPHSIRCGLVLLGLAWGANFASLVQWAITTGAPYGRLLFPTIAPAGVLLAWGMSQWNPPCSTLKANATKFNIRNLVKSVEKKSYFIGVLIIGLLGVAFVFAAAVPWLYLRPAFASPYTPTPTGVPEDAQILSLTFNTEESQPGTITNPQLCTSPLLSHTLLLLAYQAPTKDLYPGDTLPLTLYWQSTQSSQARYTTWIQVSGLDPTQRIASEDRWLGGTLYPSDFWRTGDTIRQTHKLHLPDTMAAPALYWVRLGLTDDTGARLTLEDDENHVTLGPWRVRTEENASRPAVATDFRLGEGIYLQGYTLATVDTTPVITLTWKAVHIGSFKNEPLVNYTVFVHLVAPDGTLLTQHDGPPAGGAYPTSWWLPGDVIPDVHELPALPNSELLATGTFRVGLYDPNSGLRLPVYDAAGIRLPDDAAPLPVAHLD
ncbi:MAG: phospholipid carrier-dependent glycosyltransferase [Anaerolineae bacterium]|nr:phospholipid carrier-dependent glycosyltransferase [Anaerolineae bacterium]